MSTGTVPGRISVIIPTYNYGHFITECIKSVFRQNVKDCEIIVIDDGSTDGTASILEPFTGRIRYVYQENAGLSAARNAGMKLATGEFLQFLDSDDLLGRNALRGKRDFLNANPDVSLTVCRNRLFAETDSDGLPKAKGSWELYQSNLALHLCRFNIAPPHAFLIRKSLAEEIGYFDVSLAACEDYDYWLRAVMAGAEPRYCGTGEVFYRVHSSSMSADRVKQVRFDAEMHLRIFDHLFNRKDYPTKAGLGCYFAYLAGIAKTISRLKNSDKNQAISELLTERVRDACRQTDKHLNDHEPTHHLTERLYIQWFLFEMTSEEVPGSLVSEHSNLQRLVSRSKSVSYFMSNLVLAVRKIFHSNVEARRLAQLSLAVQFPRLAARFRRD